jgi:hypothetical protein
MCVGDPERSRKLEVGGWWGRGVSLLEQWGYPDFEELEASSATF